MDNSSRLQWVLVIGGIIGAVLGAGVAYLLSTAPGEPQDDSEPEPISGKEILALTGSAAVLLRTLDDFRRRL